jgi:hypothetical protein
MEMVRGTRSGERRERVHWRSFFFILSRLLEEEEEEGGAVSALRREGERELMKEKTGRRISDRLCDFQIS